MVDLLKKTKKLVVEEIERGLVGYGTIDGW